MLDRLRLIAEIYNRPGLWDLQSEEYKSRVCVPELWKEVAASIGPDVTVDECKRKWKNLRDAYRAEIKRIEIRMERDILTGVYPKSDYVSKWAYFEHMKFIKDIKRPRRNKINETLNGSTNDSYDNNYDLEQFAELHNIDNIKLEENAEIEEDLYLLDDDDDSNDREMCKEQLLKDVEKQKTLTTDSEPSQLNLLEQKVPQTQNSTKSKSEPTCFKCSKRSYDQVNFLEDLEQEEQKLIKSTRLDLTRSNDLAHVGDSDYNFLVSFLPHLKKMNELQNLQFRAKMTEFMFSIMSQSANNNSTSSPHPQKLSKSYNNCS